MTELTILAAEMRARAEKATREPWYTTGDPWFHDACGVIAGSPDGNIGFVVADCEAIGLGRDEYEGPFQLAASEDDAAHIAASCPAYIIAVLDADAATIERLETWLDNANQAAGEFEERWRKEEKRAEAAESRLARLTAEHAARKVEGDGGGADG